MDADLEQVLLKLAPVAVDTAIQLAPMFIRLLNLSPDDRQQAIAELIATLNDAIDVDQKTLNDMDATDVKVKDMIDDIPTVPGK